MFMKRNSIFKIIGALFFVPSIAFIAGCDDDSPSTSVQIDRPEMFEDLSCPFDYDDTPSDNVLGKWKVVRTLRGLGWDLPDTLQDLSCNNVTYEFTADGRLIIESDIIEIPDSVYSYVGGVNISWENLPDISTGVNITINDSVGMSARIDRGRLSFGPFQEFWFKNNLSSYYAYLLKIK